MQDGKLDEVLRIARQKGYFWPSYEIYGGVSGFYTLGPMGVILSQDIKELWRSMFIRPFGFLEVDSPSIMPYRALKASGHVDNFKDPMAECRSCKAKFRADHLLKDAGINAPESASAEELEAMLNDNSVKCPSCGASSWSVRPFLTMFETNIGPYEGSRGFLRPETAQGIFVEFRDLYEINRKRLPMGVAQIGKGFRNEISPRQSVIRLREFHMMELELFMDPQDEGAPEPPSNVKIPILHEAARESGQPELISPAEALSKGILKSKWLAYFMYLSFRFVQALGVPPDRQRFYEKIKGERAHYSAQTFDHEVYLDDLGWVEVAGLAYRTDYDLSSHSRESGVDLYAEERRVLSTRKSVRLIVDELRKRDNWQELARLKPEIREDGVYLGEVRLRDSEYKIIEEVEKEEVRKFVPHVVEPSYGLDRLMLVSLYYAVSEREGRRLLSLPRPLLAGVVGVLPLVSNDDMIRKAREVAESLAASGFTVIFDEKGYIGKRYARLDEAGVPFAVTVDGQTVEDNTVTVRERDTWKQERVNASELSRYLRERGSPGLELTRH